MARLVLLAAAVAGTGCGQTQIVPNGTPRIHRDFGPVEASCGFDVDVKSGQTVELVYRATAGSCDIVAAD